MRRSFLDKLITGLAAEDWVDETAWGERREELARRRHVEHTRPVAKLETPAILAGAGVALFAILVPLSAALVDAGLAAEKSWAFWTGVGVYGALVLLVGCGTAWLLRNRSGAAVRCRALAVLDGIRDAESSSR